MKETIKKNLKDYRSTIILIAVLVMIFCIFAPVKITGNSMKNTLMDGDHAFALRDFVVREYQRGDIVIVQSDTIEGGKKIVKRIIATEGQIVDIDYVTGTVTVDGIILDEPYISSTTAGYGTETFPMTIKEGHVFVMGDNRQESYDSRFPAVGQIPVEAIWAKVAFVVFPGKSDDGRDFTRIGTIE